MIFGSWTNQTARRIQLPIPSRLVADRGIVDHAPLLAGAVKTDTIPLRGKSSRNIEDKNKLYVIAALSSNTFKHSQA